MISIQRIGSPHTGSVVYRDQVRRKRWRAEFATFPNRDEAVARGQLLEAAIREGGVLPHAAAKRASFAVKGPTSARTVGVLLWVAVVVGAVLLNARVSAGQPTDQAASGDSRPLQEVQVTASKISRRRLKRVAIQFVRLHAAVSPTSHQIGRWSMDVCPRVIGLKPVASAFVSRRVTEVARSVGAPTRRAGKQCQANVEIVFTSQPQQLVNQIVRAEPWLLGSARSAGDTIVRRPIQSWYLTATKNEPGWGIEDLRIMCEAALDADGAPHASDGASIDPANNAGFACGTTGSHLRNALSSEFVHVLVIVDARKVASDSLGSIADYVAMLALTRMSSLDGCNALPSIIDLLSSGCEEGDRPHALTNADDAYLKALYSADFEMNLNVEEAGMGDRMVTSIAGR